MTGRAAPAWLSELQAEFGGLLRQPLVLQNGQLVVDPGGYRGKLLAEIRERGASRTARLGVYHRQYWYRLLSVVHDQYPTVTAVLGAFATNLAAARFLTEHPPRGAEIDDAVRGFGDWVAAHAGPLLAELPGAPPGAPLGLAEAARLDVAWARVFTAPAEPAFTPPRDPGALARLRLRRVLASARLGLHHPLIALRVEAAARRGDQPVPVPPAAAAPQEWLLVRGDAGVAAAPLGPAEARLLELLEALPLAEALGALEAEAPAEARASLPVIARRWFARSVELGLWAGDPEGPVGPPAAGAQK